MTADPAPTFSESASAEVRIGGFYGPMPSEFDAEQVERVTALRQAHLLLKWGIRPPRSRDLLAVAAWIVDGTVLPDEEPQDVAQVLDQTEEPSEPGA